MFPLTLRSAARVSGCPGRSLLQMAFSFSFSFSSDSFRLVLEMLGIEGEERAEGDGDGLSSSGCVGDSRESQVSTLE